MTWVIMWTLSHDIAHRSRGPEATSARSDQPGVEGERPVPPGPAVGLGLTEGQTPAPDLVGDPDDEGDDRPAG